MHSGIAMGAKWRISGGGECFCSLFRPNMRNLDVFNNGFGLQSFDENVFSLVFKSGHCGLPVESSRSEKNFVF